MEKLRERKALCLLASPSKMFFLFFALQSLFTILVNSYKPVENLTIGCGFSGESYDSLHIRKWTGDISGSKLFILVESQKNQSSVAAEAPPSTNGAPFRKARLSHSEFTYSFPVSDGQKFIRLHFFPETYPNFSRSNALFSVTAGPYTLLEDFNASLTAEYDYQQTFFREFCVNIESDQRLNITFTPSPANQDAYAFINGIEIVSMPADLYYTNYTNKFDLGPKLVGFDARFPISNYTALETMYRINVGESPVPSERDTGMFRYWDHDDPYLKAVHAGSLPVAFDSKLKLIYKDGQNYFAPDEVYLTARSYGINKGRIANYNTTWDFEVDSDFYYMVRLHFCEIELAIQQAGDRVFQIFIDDEIAEPLADVILWSKGNLIPVHRDYAVRMSSKTSFSRCNLSIKLHPIEAMSTYVNVILNGIEIFKLNDSTGDLRGAKLIPHPSPPSSLDPSSIQQSKDSKKNTLVYIVVGTVAGFVILLSIIGFLIFRRKRALGNDGKSGRGQVALATAKSSKSHGSSLPSDLCRYFSIDEIRAATNDFDDVLKIGVGGFGNVYKGYIDNSTIPVAIKRLKPGSQQGAREFKTEIEMLSQLRHHHLVSLIGYCDDGNEMILVYDYMARGTLREHLYDSNDVLLSWKLRLEICLGAARGLDHLHTGAKYNIIHRDVKSTNILLDEKWTAKVSDFGLSKSEPIGMSKSHISTTVKGSLGYLDPEYYKRQRLTQKSDVYSFGVVLLEVLCGRPPLLRTAEKNQTNLVDWVQKCHKNGEIDQAIDPILRETITPKCLSKFIEMAFNCLLEDGNQRPSMNDLVWGLEFALQLQETEEDTTLGRVQVDGKSQEISPMLPKFVNESSEESDVQFTSTNVSIDDSKNSKGTVTSVSSEEQALISGSVFSEIRDPSAR